ncbi:3'(2'),5'-bisphosphate nucleotidase CysQ [Pararhodobacter sp. CCB-MM2]|uniref:inositol monophosphatase family protein n=1 Tax=Pararhodobacter sp. CCB-MM2 TaxID=1786003 RepID=UPI000831EC0C|nr:3'(2'),5'-bisphosphate nucleotidase CysQ [Pararhodobacter sp. CCB-MM2]
MPALEGDRDDLLLLIEAALSAGEIAKRHFRNAPKVWDKGDGQGPVTEADLEVNEHLHAVLAKARPDYGWLSEESNPLGNLARLKHDSVFVVDPIDGTRAFIDGQPGFAHALAVVRGGEPVAAAVHLPELGLTYGAVLGGGATLNSKPVTVSDPDLSDRPTMLAARPAFDPILWPGGMPEVKREFRPSLAWRLSLVGEGRFDSMLTIRDAWDWDIAGAALIATEAGARVTDRLGRKLRFNRTEAKNAGVVAAGPRLHAALMAGLTGAKDRG